MARSLALGHAYVVSMVSATAYKQSLLAPSRSALHPSSFFRQTPEQISKLALAKPSVPTLHLRTYQTVLVNNRAGPTGLADRLAFSLHLPF